MLLRRHSNTWITLFVIGWLALFQYETFRLHYLSPLVGRVLPKVPLLFPPAGWIMFYAIDPSYGFTEVYGHRRGQPILIDPHRIFATKAVGYDNIHRNMLVGVLYRDRVEPFCRYLLWKFPGYESFTVVYAQYPQVVSTPDLIERQGLYRCDR